MFNSGIGILKSMEISEEFIFEIREKNQRQREKRGKDEERK
jgi:hypothetical protein